MQRIWCTGILARGYEIVRVLALERKWEVIIVIKVEIAPCRMPRRTERARSSGRRRGFTGARASFPATLRRR